MNVCASKLSLLTAQSAVGISRYESFTKQPVLHMAVSQVFTKLHHIRVLVTRTTRTQRIKHKKYPTYAVPRTTSPTFTHVSLYDQPFSRCCTFWDFSVDFHVKIPRCHKCLKLGRLPRKVKACILLLPMFS